MRNIGLPYATSRLGGGTFQLTDNLLSGLADYAIARPGTKVHLFCFGEGDVQPLAHRYPAFTIHEVSRELRLFGSVLRRIFMAVPALAAPASIFFPLNWIARRHAIDLMIFSGTTADVSLYRGRQIFSFTDICHVFYSQFPELVANGELRRRNIMFGHGVRRADQIIVESEQLRGDTVRYYGADPAKIAILPQTVSRTLTAPSESDVDSETIAFAESLPDRFLFYPAQLWPHKNHHRLLLALSMLADEFPDLHLVLAGSRKAGDETIFTEIARLGLGDRVRWLGYVADKFMPVLYRKATALVMPTYLGPTNIPTLEAFFFGCPAIISDLPGVREQTEDAAAFFDPDSADDMAQTIRLVLTDDNLRERLRRRGAERAAELGYDTYRQRLFEILDANLSSAP